MPKNLNDLLSSKRKQAPKSVYQELEYVDDEEYKPKAIPKNRTAETDFQRRFLSICHYKYFPHKSVKSAVRKIEKAMVPASMGSELNIPIMPNEWVENCLEWADRMYRSGRPVGLNSVITLINREESKKEFMIKYYYLQRKKEENE